MTLTTPICQLSDQELVDRYDEITDRFDEYSSGDPFGWDWPTMFAVFPDLVREAKEIRSEVARRVNARRSD